MKPRKKQKIVFVSGAFNVVHPGHLRLFKFAKEIGQKLVVGLLADNLIKEKTLLKQSLRYEGLKSLEIVDTVIKINKSINETIKKLEPDFVIKGKEYENIENEEKEVLDRYGGKLIFSSGEVVFSSLELLNKEYYENSNNLNSISTGYLKSHNIKHKNLSKKIKKFKNIKTLVIGDLIVDEYLTCQNLGLSQEDPSIVVSPIDSQKYIGGAGIVASHCAALGSKVDLISVSGNDRNRKFALNKLKSYGVKSYLLKDSSRPTTLKKRFITDNKTLLKVSDLSQSSISENLQKKIYNYIKKKIQNFDLLIFSDFNYGCLPEGLVAKIISLAKKNRTFISADCQSSSQIGRLEKYKNVDYISPTEREARIALKNNDDGLVVILNQIRRLINCENVILKLGSEGILVQTTNELIKDGFETDKIPSLNMLPRDVSGAGDSMLAGSSLMLAANNSIWEAALIGSYLSSIQISRYGNIPIKNKDLIVKLK